MASKLRLHDGRSARATSEAKPKHRSPRSANATAPPIVKPRPHPATMITATYADDEFEFMQAVQAFKTQTGRRFPTCSDYLTIAKALGFARTGSVAINHAEAR